MSLEMANSILYFEFFFNFVNIVMQVTLTTRNNNETK